MNARNLSLASLIVAVLAALGGCQQRTQSSGSAADSDAASAAPGMRYEARVNAGGVEPPSRPPLEPNSSNPNDPKTGQGLFGSMNCDGCHGGGAVGWEGPSLVDGRWRYGGADEEIFKSIFYGRPKGMPAYGGVLGADGVWMIVKYLKSQAVPQVVPTTNYDDLMKPTAASVSPAGESPPPRGSEKQPESADPSSQIAQYGCTACHAVDHKVVGPAFTDVAKKYHGQDVQKRLEEKVKNGGVGVWGQIPMPPNTGVPDAEVHDIVAWVLKQG
jgi:cytochrome c